MPVWAWAFAVGLGVALAAVAQMRRMALRVGFVDVPSDRKSHALPVPYLGGVGIILGVLAGVVLEYPIGAKVMVIVLAATILGTIGLLDDDRTVGPGYRFAAEVVAAGAAAAAGLRIHATGVPSYDVALTMLWIVGITNAVNLLDNMDGLAGGLTAIAATAVFGLAVATGQPVIATLSAATVGGCLGFLAFNRPPASIFMGDSGSLFLGFLIAVATIDVNPALSPPRSFLIPLMVLAIPILDTTMVTIARVRRGRSFLQGGRDHLSHRLVARGHTPKRAVGILLGVETVVATLAFLSGRKVIPLLWGFGASVIILGTLAAFTVRVPVYLEPVAGFSRSVRRAALALVLAVPILGAPAAVALLRASHSARAGAQAAVDALRALERGDTTATVARFRDARVDLATARTKLGGPLATAGLVVPGLSANLRAARTLVDIGYQLSGQGALLAQAYAAGSVDIKGGAVPLDEIEKLKPLLVRANALLVRSRTRIQGIESAFLVPSLSAAVQEAKVQLQAQASRTSTVVEMATVLPDMLGANGPRRYFLAFQNNAELRGSGGFLGNYGELVADNGHLQIIRFGRQDDLNLGHSQPLTLDQMDAFLNRWREFGVLDAWQQVNVSPDFPTTAKVISQLYPQSGGDHVDGVIAIDPYGLADLMSLTGSISVPDWNVPITSANVVDITLNQAYQRFAQDVRVDFLGEIAQRVAQSMTHADISSPTQLGAALGSAISEQHIKVYMSRPNEQHLLQDLGATGALPPVQGDSVGIVTQNEGANKIDYYLKRSLYYHVQVQPTGSGQQAKVSGHVEVALENDAPDSGLPAQVIGPYDPRFQAGENSSYLSVYSPYPLVAGSGRVNGQVATVTSDPDTGRDAYSLAVAIPSLQTDLVDMDLAGQAQLSSDGWYRIDVQRQATVHPDHLDVTVTVPSGWKITAARGLRITGAHTARLVTDLSAPRTLWVRIQRTGLGHITDALLHGT